MDTLKTFYFRTWRPGILMLSLVLLAYLLYFHRLGSLLPGFGTSEIATYHSASSWHVIASNPVNLPYKAVLWLLVAVLHHSLLMTRAVAAGFGLAAAVAFFAIVRPWFNFGVAFISTLLFATSAGLLHFSRLGTPQILQMGALVFLWGTLWYRRRAKWRPAAGYIVVALLALLWYVPGMVWFELLGVVLLYRNIQRELRGHSSGYIVGYSVVFLAIVLPLLVKGTHDSNLLLTTAGLPTSFHQLTHFGRNIVDAFLSVGIRSTGNPLLGVGHAPLLNIIELVLALLGIYYYVLQERSVRTVFLLGSVVLSLVLLGLGGSVTYACLVPLLYLLVASGLNNLLGQWLRVFPRNPFARATGVGLVCVMLFFSMLYQVRSYFVAWPHDTATRQVFDHRQ